MKYPNANIIEKIVTITTVTLIFVGVGILFYFLSLRLGDIARENQAYNRYNACVLSIPALERTSEIIDRCWSQAQKDTGIEVKRYDGRTNGTH